MHLSVSIIVPTFNNSQMLRRAVARVLAQSIPQLQLIIVDGNPTPSILPTDSRMFHYHLPDTCKCEQINFGLRRADGVIIGCMDDNAFYSDGAIERAVDAFLDRPTLDVLGGDVLSVDAEALLIGPGGIAYHYPIYNVKTFLSRHTNPPLFWNGMFYRHNCIKSVNGVNENYKYAYDLDLQCRFLDAGFSFGAINSVQAFYTPRRETETTSHFATKNEEIDRICIERGLTKPNFLLRATIGRFLTYSQNRYRTSPLNAVCP